MSGTLENGLITERRTPGVALPILLTALITALVLAVLQASIGTDTVGRDNDDVMRLVQVRDLMAGQAWFDLTQYRLGLDGGTAMHWSRLVDLPIAGLIGLFSLFVEPPQAEAAALFVWPLLLLVPLLTGTAIAAKHLNGRHGMLVALLLTALFAFTQARFRPGAIDHHNVQLALLVLVVAGLTDPRMRRSWFAVAGVTAGLAVAVGAEIVPIIAVICVAAAVVWASSGAPARDGICAFGLAFSGTLTACFYLLVPPTAYHNVVCDAYSAGFYVLGTLGGGLLFFVAALASNRSAPARFAVLGTAGLLMGVATLLFAPQCLRSPLADLDPLLHQMWLSKVTEALSIGTLIVHKPEMVPGHYAVPLLALMVCIWKVVRSDRRTSYALMLAVLAMAFAISLVQVRGSVFANLLAIIPLAAVIGERRAVMHASPKPSLRTSLGFVLLAVMSTQVVWSIAGVLAFKGAASAAPIVGDAPQDKDQCTTQAALAGLAAEPPGVVSAVSNMGSDILRHTPHRVLSAPYHRNQGGMLAQLHIAMAGETEAEAHLRDAGVTLVAFCAADPEAIDIARAYPESLTAALMTDAPPAYLLPVSGEGPLAVYRVRPAGLADGWTLK